MNQGTAMVCFKQSKPVCPLLLITMISLLSLFNACSEDLSPDTQEQFSEEVVTLNVENISQFTYDSLYAHMSPDLNLDTARLLTRGSIEPSRSTVIELPVGSYLSAIRFLVERGPKVAIRSESPLTPALHQDRLQLLDEGFILKP